jgi:hypothetical protein
MTKILAILGGIIGILSVLLFIFEPSLGWWEVTVQIIMITNSAYINPFGYTPDGTFLGPLFIFASVLFLVGAIFILVAAAINSKGFSILCALLMFGGLALYCYALIANEDFDAIITGLETLFGAEYTVLWGTADLGLLGIWTWRLGNGFIIAVAGAAIALVGAFLVKKRK